MKKENIWSVEKNNKKIEGKGGGEKERRREGKKIFEAGKYFFLEEKKNREGKEGKIMEKGQI